MLYELAGRPRGSIGGRYSTPAHSDRKIPKPEGSAGRSGTSRAGFNLEEALMLSEEHYSKLRVSTFNDIPHVFDASDASIVDGGKICV